MSSFNWPKDIETAGSVDFDGTEAALDDRLGSITSTGEHLAALVPLYEKLADCLESSDIGAVAENAVDRLETLAAIEKILRQAQPLLEIAQAEHDRQIQRWADDDDREPVDSRDTVLALPACAALVELAKKLEVFDKQIEKWESVDWMLGDIIDLSSMGIYEKMSEHEEVTTTDDPTDNATIIIEFLSELATKAYIEGAIADLMPEDDDEEEDDESA